MTELSCITVEEIESPEYLVTATVYEHDNRGTDEQVRETIQFGSVTAAKLWLDGNGESIGLDECWNELLLTRVIEEEGFSERILFRMELVCPEDSHFDINNLKSQTRLTSLLCADDGSMQILTFGMAVGVREFDRQDVPLIWSTLFHETLAFYDLFQIFEFSPAPIIRAL